MNLIEFTTKSMMTKRKIILVDYGISSVYSDGTIEINRKLKGELREAILKHERRHTIGKYSLKDFKNDFQAQKPHFVESLKFALKNPEALINYFALMYSYNKKVLTWNSTALYPFVYFGAIFMVFCFIFVGISPITSAFLWTFYYACVNAILLATTHRYVTKIHLERRIRRRNI